MKTRVFLIGGFNETRFLAQSLLEKDYDVIAINDNLSHCEQLGLINELTVYHGDGSKPYILEDADAYDADIAIAMTERDDDNLVICELCKKKFRIKKTVALINDPNKTDFFLHMGIDSVVSALAVLSNVIEQQALLNDIATLIPIGGEGVQALKIRIPDDAASIGKRLWELDLPKDIIIGCILRRGKTMIPRGDSRINAEDQLIIITTVEDEAEAIQKLTGR